MSVELLPHTMIKRYALLQSLEFSLLNDELPVLFVLAGKITLERLKL